MTIPQDFDLKAELKKCKTAEDLTGKNGLVQRLIGGMLEQLLQNEMNEHLGYEKHSVLGDHSGNSRNGKTKKTVKSNYGNVELEIPRDRNGEFEPTVVKKHHRSSITRLTSYGLHSPCLRLTFFVTYKGPRLGNG